MRQKRNASTALLAVAVLLFGSAENAFAQAVQAMASGERYAAKPVGWDSPAGKCVVCHSLEKGGPSRVGPPLWGIVGAHKGRAKGYGYSLALAKAGGVWTEQDLDKYLTAPSRFLPGTSKAITGLTNPKERAELISYLAKLKD